MELTKKILWFLFALAAIGIGLYPIAYFFAVVRQNSLLATKSWELLMSNAYMTAFYTHISSGGLALLTGWSQFLRSWRNKYLTFHRYLGYFYVTAVFTSSISGFIIAFYSTGGTTGVFGFGSLAVSWFTTNALALISIKKGKVKEHEQWMMRNYSLAFGAVTLRICLPILLAMGLTIVQALALCSWICWIPNVVGMEIYIQSQYGGMLSKAKQNGNYMRESLSA